MSVNLLGNDEARAPVLIAGWPGMGQVGLGACDYLRQKLNAQLFAQIDVGSYHLPDALTVEDGIGRMPDPPKQDLYYCKEPPLFIFEGDAQLNGQPGFRLAAELLDCVRRHGTETVYTGAAYAMAVSFRQRPDIFAAATDEQLKVQLAALEVKPLKEGSISGLNGLLLGLAAQRGMPAACLLATMPHYAIEAPNPKASRALIQVFQRILNTSVDMTDIDEAVRQSDQMFKDFEGKVNEAIQQLKENLSEHAEAHEGEGPEPEERPEPHDLMQRVEQLFEEVQRDRAKATILKQELDRWGIFHLYEDRFLDLFEKQHRPGL
ncbi:MAG TPA: PAC2 family protein [bacterium]|nr:PAC2 family protein [bacterium]